MRTIVALILVASTLVATASTAVADSDTACGKCVVRRCESQADVCMHVDGCPALVQCLTVCLGKSNQDACVRQCTANTSEAADHAALSIIKCKNEACHKECFTN